MSGTQAAGRPGAGPALAAVAAHPVGAAVAQRWPWSLIALLAGVFAALLIGALLVIGSLRRGEKDRDLVGRIERYGPRHVPAPAGAGEKRPATPSAGRRDCCAPPTPSPAWPGGSSWRASRGHPPNGCCSAAWPACCCRPR